jgi:hypothetical protein
MGKTIDNKSTIDEYSQYIGNLKPEVSFWQGRKYVDQKTQEKYTLNELVKRLESVVKIDKLSPLETLKTEHAVEKLKKMDLEGARQLEKNLLINKFTKLKSWFKSLITDHKERINYYELNLNKTPSYDDLLKLPLSKENKELFLQKARCDIAKGNYKVLARVLNLLNEPDELQDSNLSEKVDLRRNFALLILKESGLSLLELTKIFININMHDHQKMNIINTLMFYFVENKLPGIQGKFFLELSRKEMFGENLNIPEYFYEHFEFAINSLSPTNKRFDEKELKEAFAVVILFSTVDKPIILNFDPNREN